MQERQIVLGLFVPSPQKPTKPIHPAMRALDHPATGFLVGIPPPCLGFFPARADVRGEAKFPQQVTHLVIVVALLQVHPLRSLSRWLRTWDHQPLQRDSGQFHVMAIGAVDDHAQGHPVTFRQYAPLDPLFAAIGWVAAGFFPQPAALWSRRRPDSTRPSRSRAGHRTARPRSARASETPPRQSTLEIDRARWTWRTGSSGSGRSTGSPSVGHKRSHPHSPDPAPAAAHRQSDGYSPAPAATVPPPPKVHQRSETRSSSGCLGSADASASRGCLRPSPLLPQRLTHTPSIASGVIRIGS